MRLVGFSRTPTQYRMTLPQSEDFVYVKCGADILINGLKTDLKAEARCPTCGNVTRFRINNRRIEDLAPSDPALHVVELELEPRTPGHKMRSNLHFRQERLPHQVAINLYRKTGDSNLATRIHRFSESSACNDSITNMN